MKSEKKRRKISVDLDTDVEMLLDTKKREDDMSYTVIINELSRSLLGLDPALRAELSEFCRFHYNKIKTEDLMPGSVAYGEKYEKKKQLDRIYRLLNHNSPIDPRPSPISWAMQEVKILDGTVQVPLDWIQIEWDSEDISRCAGIVEIRLAEHCLPIHFFFTSKRDIHMLSDEDEIAIAERCSDSNEEAREALHLFFTMLKKDHVPLRKLKGCRVYIPELFQIPDAGSRGDDERDYPYSAKVYRD